MSQTIVRLQGLELRNIKNVEFGKIEMPTINICAHTFPFAANISDVLNVHRRS